MPKWCSSDSFEAFHQRKWSRRWQTATLDSATTLRNIDNQLWLCCGTKVVVFDQEFVKIREVTESWFGKIRDVAKLRDDVIFATEKGIFSKPQLTGQDVSCYKLPA